jgi:hypothetical protein
MRTTLFGCLLLIFLYFVLGGCTDPSSLPAIPEHYTLVPSVDNLQAIVGISTTGKRMIVLSWRYDTTNTNIRSWDVLRTITDTSQGAYLIEQSILKPSQGYPSYIDQSEKLQFLETPSPDSIDVYYRVVPNGQTRGYTGKPSDNLHVVVYKN